MNNDAEIKSGIIRQCTDEVYTAEQYAKDHARMCGENSCANCAMGKIMRRKSKMFAQYGVERLDCIIYANLHPVEVVAATRKWAKEHPEPSEK